MSVQATTRKKVFSVALASEFLRYLSLVTNCSAVPMLKADIFSTV